MIHQIIETFNPLSSVLSRFDWLKLYIGGPSFENVEYRYIFATLIEAPWPQTNLGTLRRIEGLTIRLLKILIEIDLKHFSKYRIQTLKKYEVHLFILQLSEIINTPDAIKLQNDC